MGLSVKQQKKWLGRMTILFLILVMSFSVNAFAASPKLNKKTLTLNVGQSYTLKLKNYKKTVKWKSSSYVKAPISTSGKVTARKKGTVTLTAVAGKKKYTCKLTIKQPVTKLTLNKKTYEMKVGDSVTLKATASPSTANNKKVTWSTGNKKIATVSSSGKVKAVGAGTVTITAITKDGSKKVAACRITVKKKTTTQESSGTTGTTAGGSKGESAAAVKFLNALEMMSNQVKSDVANGRVWIYGDTKYPKSWQKQVAAVAAGEKGSCVCSEIVRWGMTLSGNFTNKQHMYALASGKIHFNAKLKSDPDFNKKFEVLTVNKTASQLLKEGNLLPGDVCSWKGHMNVYAGDGKWYDAGRGFNTTYKNGVYYFKSFGPGKSDYWMSNTIVQIVRLK